MATKISWATETWSPISGCTPVSAGCKNCYAKKFALRFRGRFGYPADEPFRVTFHPDKLDKPLHWKRPRRVFVVSMGDLFHKDVPDGEIDRVFAIMALCRNRHTFLLLTKRPERMVSYFHRLCYEHLNEAAGEWTNGMPLCINPPWPLPNVWLGISCENQATADERIPHLLQCSAAVRYISYEPALGSVDWNFCSREDKRKPDDDFPVGCHPCPTNKHWQWISDTVTCIDQLIIGAESNGSRPGRECKLEWIESAVEQAQAASLPIFVKQIHLDGKLIKDIKKFPKHLQVQEYPA